MAQVSGIARGSGETVPQSLAFGVGLSHVSIYLLGYREFGETRDKVGGSEDAFRGEENQRGLRDSVWKVMEPYEVGMLRQSTCHSWLRPTISGGYNESVKKAYLGFSVGGFVWRCSACHREGKRELASGLQARLPHPCCSSRHTGLAGAGSIVGSGSWPVACGHPLRVPLRCGKRAARCGWVGDLYVAHGLAVQIWSCLRWDCPGMPEKWGQKERVWGWGSRSTGWKEMRLQRGCLEGLL